MMNPSDAAPVFEWKLVQSISDEILPPVSGHTLVYSDVPVRRAYLFGGWDGTKLFNDLWIWNVDDQEWKRLRKPEELLEELKTDDEPGAEESKESSQEDRAKKIAF